MWGSEAYIKKENVTWKLTVVNKYFVSRSISLTFTVIFIENFSSPSSASLETFFA